MKTEIIMFIVKFLIATIGVQIIFIIGAFVAEHLQKYRIARYLYAMIYVAIPFRLFQNKTEAMCNLVDEKYRDTNCKCWGCMRYTLCHPKVTKNNRK